MTRRFQVLAVVLALAVTGPAAARIIKGDPLEHEFALAPGGVIVIDNAFGNIQVSTHDAAKVIVSADRVISAVDPAAYNEARQAVQRVIEGNERMKFIRTVHSIGQNPRWSAQVHYKIVVPRSTNIKIQSNQTGLIRVSDLSGQLSVKSFVGPILIENPGNLVAVESINGDVTLVASRGITSNAQLVSINGSITVHTSASAGFVWDVDTVMGEARTTLPLKNGRILTPTRFRGTINDPTNVTLVTQSFKGNVTIIGNGSTAEQSRPLRDLVAKFTQRTASVGPSLPQNRGGVQLPLVQKSFQYATTIGDVKIDEIRGAAKIYTGGGEINLGAVFGHADLLTRGGPLTLGEVTGPLTARTEGGSISIQRAREGGTIVTGGGTIQVQYLGGPGQLNSGGGDIVVRQAANTVNAETRSGDVMITLDPKLKSNRVTAKTAKGNVLLTVPAGFGADVDATILTSDPSAHSIRSDIPGLSVQREQVGAKTRIRATGRLNGGGEKLELQAQDGGIHIAVDAPRVSPQVP
jgi:DUF4097 and DUF4098 domain-containing protein YvlB